MKNLILNGIEMSVGFDTNLSLFGRLEHSERNASLLRQIIVHHDACGSAAACFTALAGRGLATHFCVDNDGTVFQFLDPGVHNASHAAGYVIAGGARVRKGFNRHSIGIDISNLVSLDFRGRYRTPRPEMTCEIHGRPVSGMCPYPNQIDVALELIELLAGIFGIEPVCPADTRWTGKVKPDSRGIFGHLHINPQKIDPFGFPWTRIEQLRK